LGTLKKHPLFSNVVNIDSNQSNSVPLTILFATRQISWSKTNS